MSQFAVNAALAWVGCLVLAKVCTINCYFCYSHTTHYKILKIVVFCFVFLALLPLSSSPVLCKYVPVSSSRLISQNAGKDFTPVPDNYVLSCANTESDIFQTIFCLNLNDSGIQLIKLKKYKNIT